MNKPLQKLRRFFARTGTPKKYNATATRDDLSASYDEDESSNRLSGAFVVVLLLHIVALVGVFAFAKVKESRAAQMPPEPQKKTATTKSSAKLTAPAVAPALAASSAPVQENPAPAPAPRGAAPSPTAAPEAGRRHVVKIGETLGKISVAYTVPVSELMKSNNLKNEADVHTGQLLTIPEGKIAAKQTVKAPEVAPAAPAKALPNSFIVRKNDTIAKIARELGVNYEEMVKLNSIKEPKTIQIGQVLKVPKKN